MLGTLWAGLQQPGVMEKIFPGLFTPQAQGSAPVAPVQSSPVPVSTPTQHPVDVAFNNLLTTQPIDKSLYSTPQVDFQAPAPSSTFVRDANSLRGGGGVSYSDEDVYNKSNKSVPLF